MSEPSLLWVLGMLVTVVIGIAVAFFNHVRDCKNVAASIADLKARVKALEREDER